LLSAVAAFAVWGGITEVAYAAPTIAVRKCSIYPCDNALSLKNEARAAYGSLPLGSIVFVSSQQYPLSAFVRICTGPRGGKDACLITSGDLGAIELDNQVYARAAKIPPISIPPSVGGSASQAIPELVEGEVLRVLQFALKAGISPWHNILNPSTWEYMDFIDTRTLERHRVHTRDRIIVRFADGSTAELELFGVGAPSGHFFRFVPESTRRPNGEPYVTLPPPPPASPSGSGLNLTPPWLNGGFVGALAFGYCAFLQSHCEFVSGGIEVNCYYRRQNFPCG
jgi:hypothetical protein